jgi:glycine cleavage system regulatory protein
VHNDAHLWSGFPAVMDCSKLWTGVFRTARKAEQLRNSLLEIDGLQVGTRWTSDERVKETQPLRKFRKILLRGADNPGLVYNVTEYLFSHGINIENLETHTEQVPTSLDSQCFWCDCGP